MKITMVKDYLNHFVNNTLCELESLSNNVVIDYSTVGKHEGKSEVVKTLKTDGNFAHRYNLLSNIIQYQQQDKNIVIANVFHYFVKVVKNQYSPLIIGGKYKFVICHDLIEKVLFDLEAEMGNTYLAKKEWGWKLFEETKDIRRVKLDDDSYVSTDKEAVEDCLKRFFLITDTQQIEFLDQYVSEDSVCILATTTYSEQFGADECLNSGISIEEFINSNKSKEDQNHHSFKICDLKIDGNKAKVVIDMLEPTNLGFKHFDALSVYKPYYNEEWNIELVKEERWRIKKLTNRPISKFQTIGYDTLEV